MLFAAAQIPSPGGMTLGAAAAAAAVAAAAGVGAAAAEVAAAAGAAAAAATPPLQQLQQNLKTQAATMEGGGAGGPGLVKRQLQLRLSSFFCLLSSRLCCMQLAKFNCIRSLIGPAVYAA